MNQFWKKTAVGVCLLSLALTGCKQTDQTKDVGTIATEQTDTAVHGSSVFDGATVIALSDSEITVDGSVISKDAEDAVYAANDIVCYLEGQGIAYGAGEKSDEHTKEEADAHTVVHITKAGTYVLSGTLSAGQIAVDLGEDAKKNPEAVVTLIFNGVDIKCSVAPAVIFYQVYECGSADAESAGKEVDTAAAGANVLIADDSVNEVSGSYVARIYKPESVVLSEDGTKVEDAKKLHKYDGAFYSKMSMNINGGEIGNGVLKIAAENEGLDSELHLTINGGNIQILSGNDGINTNEDGVSIITVNGGSLTIQVSGTTGEGDGVDSNGWIVINGGLVLSEACSFSADSGIDSDMGIFLNGGTVIATGNMLDKLSDGTQTYAVFGFASRQKGGETYLLKNEAEEVVFTYTPANDFQYLIVSSADLTAGVYSLWQGDKQIAVRKGSQMGGFGGGMPQGMEPPKQGETPEGVELPEGMEPPEGMYRPNNGEMSDWKLPEGAEKPEEIGRPVEGDELFGLPENGQPPQGSASGAPHENGSFSGGTERTTEIVITDGGNYFENAGIVEE